MRNRMRMRMNKLSLPRSFRPVPSPYVNRKEEEEQNEKQNEKQNENE
jgi:hypothetical protein